MGFAAQILEVGVHMRASAGFHSLIRPSPPTTAIPSARLSNVSFWTAIRVL